MSYSFVVPERCRKHRADRPCNRALLLLSLLVTFAGVTACWRSCLWPRAGEFISSLRCGMTREEIAAAAKQFAEVSVREPESNRAQWNFVAYRRGTTISMKLEPDGLKRIQVSWQDTIMHVQVLPEMNLCSPVEPLRQGQ